MCAPRLLIWLIHEEVFPDKFAFTWCKRAAAAKAGDLAIHGVILGPRVDEFVIGPAVGTSERRGRLPVHTHNLGAGFCADNWH